MLFLASMGETGLSHDIFFKFSLWPFEVVEVEWRSMLNFEAATSKFGNCSSKFGFSPQKGKVDLCMTNGSKVLIYLTFLYFIFYCTLVSNAKGNIGKPNNFKSTAILYKFVLYLLLYSRIWNIAKSNKSELWNHLSYRGLPFLFEVNYFCRKL